MSLEAPVVIIGIGELGAVFARGFLKTGHPVVPVTRDHSPADVAREIEAPALVLVAVGENDLHPMLASLPPPWRSRLGLVQNELLPRVWKRHGIEKPTVSVVWFEKKAGIDSKVLLPTASHGPNATLVTDALSAIGIASENLDRDDALLHALVAKNLYILTVNLAGLRVGGTVEELWSRERAFAHDVAHDVLRLQAALTERELATDALYADLTRAIEADPSHKCMGRSAPARLERALRQATDLALDVPTLRAIARERSAP